MTPQNPSSSAEMQKLLARVKKRHNWLIKWFNFQWYIEETETYRAKSTALKSDTDELDSAINFHADLVKYVTKSEEYIRTLEKEHREMREVLIRIGHSHDEYCLYIQENKPCTCHVRFCESILSSLTIL